MVRPKGVPVNGESSQSAIAIVLPGPIQQTNTNLLGVGDAQNVRDLVGCRPPDDHSREILVFTEKSARVRKVSSWRDESVQLVRY